MDDSKVVEIYSAVNSLDAYAVSNALNDEGIKARIVGNGSEGAVGGLAFGLPIAPRVCVRREDEAHARALLKHWNVNTAKTSASLVSE